MKKFVSYLKRVWYTAFQLKVMEEQKMIKVFSPQTIANYFIEMASKDAAVVTNIKLQKLVYIAHGWSLAVFDFPLVDEGLKAWRYGPVFPSLYRTLRHYGRDAIQEKIPDHSSRDLDTLFENSPDYRELLEMVWSRYGELNGIQLSTMTHQKGTPWDLVKKTSPDDDSPAISDVIISEHYKKLLAKIEDNESVGE